MHTATSGSQEHFMGPELQSSSSGRFVIECPDTAPKRCKPGSNLWSTFVVRDLLSIPLVISTLEQPSARMSGASSGSAERLTAPAVGHHIVEPSVRHSVWGYESEASSPEKLYLNRDTGSIPYSFSIAFFTRSYVDTFRIKPISNASTLSRTSSSTRLQI